MSIEDHRAWVATYGEWTPLKPRPDEKLVEHVIAQLATALDRSEAELVNDVIARVDLAGARAPRALGTSGALWDSNPRPPD